MERPAALGPQVGGADGVLALGRRSNSSWTTKLRPRRVEVGVVGPRHQRHELRARRAGADLGDRDRAVRPAEPLHVGEAGAAGRARGARRGRRDGSSSKRPPSMSRGSSTHHWIHGFSSTVERRRQVAADRVPDAARRRRARCRRSAPRRRGTPRAARGRRAASGAVDSQASAGRRSSIRNVPASAGTGQRLHHEREADTRSRTRTTSSADAGGRRCRAHGTPARVEAPSSSAPCRGSCGRPPRPCRGCRAARAPAPSGTWRFSRMATSRSTEPRCRAER